MNGNPLGNGPQLAEVSGNPPARLTALGNGGYVFTWYDGSRLLGQYYDSADRPVGEQFVIASAVVANASFVGFQIGSPYAIVATADGFAAIYQAMTGEGNRVFETRFTAPAMS